MAVPKQQGSVVSYGVTAPVQINGRSDSAVHSKSLEWKAKSRG